MTRETQTGDNGYPLYRRRSPENGGFKTNIRMKIRHHYEDVEVKNRWIVPYNPILSKIFHAHTNVEICSSIKSIKYVLRYLAKEVIKLFFK